MHSTSTSAEVRLRLDAFTAWSEREGLATEGEQAERLGVDRTTVSRVRRGDVNPGEKFIAAVLTATGAKFERFFEIAEAS